MELIKICQLAFVLKLNRVYLKDQLKSLDQVAFLCLFITLHKKNDIISRLSNIPPLHHSEAQRSLQHALSTDFAFHYSPLPHRHYLTVSAKVYKLNALFKNYFTGFQRPLYKPLRTSNSTKIHCITPVQHHCNYIFFVLKLVISVSLEIGLILRLKVFILVHRFLCSYLRVFVQIVQRSMEKKKYIILGKCLSQNS